MALLATVAACDDGEDAAPPTTVPDGLAAADIPLPPAALAVTGREPYRSARWSWLVVDPSDGRTIHAGSPDDLVLTASTAKTITVGAAYDVLGPDHRVTTPVYVTAPPDAGVLTGDLVLVASGDLALGARGAADDRFDFTPDAPDHVYGDVLPGAQVLTGDDPLAGLRSLAQQVSAAGINRVAGDVIIDSRLWETFDAQEGPVPSIFVNDNLLDLLVTPGLPGSPATIATRPATAAFGVQSGVTTGPAGSDADLTVTVDPANPRLVRVTGTAPAGETSLTVHRVTDAVVWARTLFVEALEREGVAVDAEAVAANAAERLPARGTYTEDRRVARLVSAPLSEAGGMILATSYNTGANALVCLLAVHRGSTDCTEGLDDLRAAAGGAGIPAAELVLVDGQGGDPASITPRSMVAWLRHVRSQPWGAVLEEGLPVLGERGSLATTGTDSPARGRVRAKTGTTAAEEPGTGRLFVPYHGLAGYLDVDGVGDQVLVFVVGVSGAVFPDVSRGIVQVSDDVAAVAAAFQQAGDR